MMIQFKKIMIFGRPGSGKSTFANQLSIQTNLTLYHLDKYFFKANWVERDSAKFMDIQEKIVRKTEWIIDGNSIRSLETRWANADLVLYFNYSKYLCLYRLIKRLFCDRSDINDRALGCHEVLRFRLVKYMWKFPRRVEKPIKELKLKYPHVKFIEIKSEKDLLNLRNCKFF